MENLFATFEPIELKPSPSKEDISKYYLENNIVMDNDYLNNYFGITPPTVADAKVTTPTPRVPKYSISELLSQVTHTEKKPMEVISNPDIKLDNPPDRPITAKAKSVIDYFVGKGLTREQAAGIAGNIHAESSFNTGAHGDNGASFGLAQWNKSRKNNYLNFAKSRGAHQEDFNTQLDFLWQELQTTENKALKELLNTKTTTDAARVFANKFERMAQYNPKREQMAHYYFSQS